MSELSKGWKARQAEQKHLIGIHVTESKGIMFIEHLIPAKYLSRCFT